MQTSSDAVGARRAEQPGRLPVARTRRFTLGDLDAKTRETVIDDLYDIYRGNANSLTREGFVKNALPSDTTRVAQFYGADERLAGFAVATLLRVKAAGREHAVFSAIVHFRLAYRGGSAAALFGLTEALRFKLENPRVPLSYVTVCSTPAVYSLFARTMPRFYPHPTLATPAYVHEIARAVTEARGMTPAGADPWLIPAVARPNAPERLRDSSSLREDPNVRFFLERNPNYAGEGGTGLLTYMPLDLPNIVSGVARAGLAQLSAIARGKRRREA